MIFIVIFPFYVQYVREHTLGANV